VQVTYGGLEYVIGDRSADDVVEEIEQALAAGRPAWLTVNYGEAQPIPCRLLLTPGVPVVVVEFPVGERE
jgi:hypothetical protein